MYVLYLRRMDAKIVFIILSDLRSGTFASIILLYFLAFGCVQQSTSSIEWTLLLHGFSLNLKWESFSVDDTNWRSPSP